MDSLDSGYVFLPYPVWVKPNQLTVEERSGLHPVILSWLLSTPFRFGKFTGHSSASLLEL